MYYGLDSNNNKIYIENSLKESTYRCPICKGVLVRKFGSIKAHHFAHKTTICDAWYHDNKGQWHKDMQSHFRPEQCEVKIAGENGEFHIADVFIEGKRNNIIIEFQHSSISKTEFDERNRFYKSHNCKYSSNGEKISNTIIWVFDYKDKRMFIDTGFKDKYGGYKFQLEPALKNKMCVSVSPNWSEFIETQSFKEINKNLYANILWKRPSKIFDNVNRMGNIYIFFDVKQRRYITGEKEWEGHVSEWHRYLGEPLNDYEAKKLIGFDDTLAEFMIFVFNDELYWPYHLHGKCLNYTDFFDFYCNL